MNKREQILFSCVGTTDPVRGHRDGGLIHIVRKYRPKAICLFVSREMEDLSYAYSVEGLKFISGKLGGYAPEVIPVLSGIGDPSDLDLLDRPMREAFEGFHARYPEAEILVNLSSGTPQMEIILSQLALSPAYRTLGIQIKNPEGKAGFAPRTNDPKYNLKEELENNQDDLPGAKDRCVIPNLFAIRREREWREVRTLLDRRDYAAIVNRTDSILPADLLDIVRHLHQRDLLHSEEARKIAETLPPELDLYPGPPEGSGGTAGNYWSIADYWLMMKNLLWADKYSDFVLRLSVLTLFLEEELLKTLLAERGVAYEDLMVGTEHGKDYRLSMEELEARLPDVYRTLFNIMDAEIGKPPRDGFSVYLYTRLLRCLLPKKRMQFFSMCDNLTWRRNDVAHRLASMSAADFKRAANMDREKFIKQMERAIQEVYSPCDSGVFDVHERCAKYMEEHR